MMRLICKSWFQIILQPPESYGVPSADPVTEYNDNNAVPAVEAPDSYGIPQGDPFTEEEASQAPTGDQTLIMIIQ